MLGRLLSGLLGSRASEPAPADLSRRIDAMEGQLKQLTFLATVELRLRCAQALTELLAEPRYAAPGRLERHGRKVWSQNDEDGILEEIFHRIGAGARRFVEFGVGDGRECNTLKLLVEGWQGLWMEAHPPHCERIRSIFAGPLAEGRLELLQSAVTAENVAGLIAGSRAAAGGELDLLSIDIDGNDYYVLQAVAGLRARVVVIEYNAKYPPPMDLVPRYEPGHVWAGTDYAGASLQAIANLAARSGYRLVGTGITGVNAFFVRADLAGERFAEPDAAALYNPARFWLSVGIASGHTPGERFDYLSDRALQALRSR